MSLSLEQRGTDTIPVAQLKTGASYCILTSAGRLGALDKTVATTSYTDPPALLGFNCRYVIWATT